MTLQIQAQPYHSTISSIQKSKTFGLTLSVGLAMFSMFFGAGNIVYPLAVGQFAGDQTLLAILGLILTAAIMPMVGVIAMVLFEGDYLAFFGRLGRWPGFILALLMVSLLGPLGSTPRCIALSYTTFQHSFTQLPAPLFSALACSIVFLCTVKKRRILEFLGWVLTPMLLISLISIIVIGWLSAPQAPHCDIPKSAVFLHGLNEGYNTMDLLAAFFFSSTILTLLKMQENAIIQSQKLKISAQASLIAAVLLIVVYIGFSDLAACHGMEFMHLEKTELLAAMMIKIAGPYAGSLVCVTIALACLTTAIALISAFVDFLEREVFHDKVAYEVILAISLMVTFIVSIFEFTKISAFLWPILQICYPGLIALTFLNIGHRLWGWKIVKGPVWLAFFVSAILSFLS